MLNSLYPLVCLLLLGGDPPPQGDFQHWLDFYTAEAAKYEFFVDGRDDAPLTLEPAPIFHYSNPVRSADQHGALFVWTRNGRPEVIGSIWSSVPAGADASLRGVSHEFHSLSTSGITSHHAPRVARRGPVPDWQTTDPGIEWQPVDGAAPPAAMPALRLIQMKRLAAEFTARIETSDVERRDTLRLVTQPLFRYAGEAAGLNDGALFAFVQATDPELLLLIEARSTRDGPRWHYAAARFAHLPLSLSRRDQDVWSCEKGEPYVSGNPYFMYWRVTEYDGLPELPQP